MKDSGVKDLNSEITAAKKNLAKAQKDSIKMDNGKIKSGSINGNGFNIAYNKDNTVTVNINGTSYNASTGKNGSLYVNTGNNAFSFFFDKNKQPVVLLRENGEKTRLDFNNGELQNSGKVRE